MTAAQRKEFIETHEQRTAWKDFSEFCWLLSGDAVLVPFKDGEPDWANASRENLEKVNHWSDFSAADIPRLAILTDSFDRFIGKGADVSVVTLWREGTPIIQQIDGEPCARALDLIMEAIVDDVSLEDAAGLPVAAPAAANDNTPPSSARHNTPPTAETDRPLPVICPAEWHGKPIPVREWYATDLIPNRQVTIVSGDGGVGKSLFALQIAAAGALGVDTMGVSPAAGRVVYLGAEDEAAEFHRRLADIVATHGKDLGDLSDFRLLPLADRDALLASPDARGNMRTTPLFLMLVDVLCKFQPKLVVLDTAADLFGGDEIKRGQVRQFIGILRHVAISLDCAVVLLTHPSVSGMQSGTGSSGSTAWNNSVRSRLYLTRPEGKDTDPDLRLLTTKKSNYGAVGGETKLRWKAGVFALDDGKPQVGSILLAAKAERVFRDVLSAINRTGERVAKTKGINYAPKIMAERPDAEGMSVKQLEAAMQRLLVAGDLKVVMEGPPSKPRQRLLLTSEDFGPQD